MTASATAGSPKVELRDVNLRYFALEDETEALKGVSIAIAPGEFVAIIGPSGCGKSTLLSLISGILMPTDGAVLVDGKPVGGPSRAHWACQARPSVRCSISSSPATCSGRN